MRTQAATNEYARSVPIDIMSTKAFRSKRKAIRARRTGKTAFALSIYILSKAYIFLIIIYLSI